MPYTTAESFNPEDLWKWMARYEKETGGQVLTMAHNGNMSNGIMFPVETNPSTGEPLGKSYMAARMRWEPLYEVTQEKVYNVVWGDADKRKLDPKGKLPAVGNTVNVAEATWMNTIGDPELLGVWEDPDFDPEQRAFYYLRVMEIPTPRWTAYDAMRYKVKMDSKVPMYLQERAYTSPIWYTP